MLRFAAIALVLVGCSEKKQGGGLPPAQEWGGGGTAGEDPHGGTTPANPHAGMNMNGGDPANPHAGLDMSGAGGDPANPHAGMDMSGGGADVSKLGLPAPDPNRPIDPTHHIKGVIKIHPKAADRVKPGTAVFLIVKRADASGQPTGTPLAVDKQVWQKDELAFEITERQAMIAGTQLTGDVVIIAHYDQDGDAISKQPGDILGQLRVTVPADNVKLFLDDVLP
jgi:hypothetical protein